VCTKGKRKKVGVRVGTWPNGKAVAFGANGCGFDSCRSKEGKGRDLHSEIAPRNRARTKTQRKEKKQENHETIHDEQVEPENAFLRREARVFPSSSYECATTRQAGQVAARRLGLALGTKRGRGGDGVQKVRNVGESSAQTNGTVRGATGTTDDSVGANEMVGGARQGSMDQEHGPGKENGRRSPTSVERGPEKVSKKVKGATCASGKVAKAERARQKQKATRTCIGTL
jgi:hypothetical protein